MKPNNLKSPFLNKDECHISIHDRVWYVPPIPECNPNFVFPGWNDSLLFGNNNPVNIEYCSGNGAWIASKAKENPHLNWVAVEKKFTRVKKIWSKLKNFKLENLIILCGEGLYATKHYIPSQSITSAYVNFPDPWPKLRHAKHRLIQKDFVDEVDRIMFSNGELTLVTDDLNYSQQMIDVVTLSPGFMSCYPNPYFITGQEDYGSSWFESLWKNAGREIRFHKFKKK